MATQHDAQAAICLATWSCRHAVHHFLLQHEIHVADDMPEFHEPKEQWGRNVVREVADNTEFVAKTGEIEFQYVVFVNRYVRLIRESLPDYGGEVAIKFYGMELSSKFCQGIANGSAAGADLDDGVGIARLNGSNNLLDCRRVGQEMLAEALAWTVPATHKLASFEARSTAAIMLPGSALPVPAMSRAVP